MAERKKLVTLLLEMSGRKKKDVLNGLEHYQTYQKTMSAWINRIPLPTPCSYVRTSPKYISDSQGYPNVNAKEESRQPT